MPLSYSNDGLYNTYCNCCINSYFKKQNNKEEKKMSEVQILITFPGEEHIKIEEICMNEGLSFSDYFLALHKIRNGENKPKKETEYEAIPSTNLIKKKDKK
jgi:hypothetical protein